MPAPNSSSHQTYFVGQLQQPQNPYNVNESPLWPSPWVTYIKICNLIPPYPYGNMFSYLRKKKAFLESPAGKPLLDEDAEIIDIVYGLPDPVYKASLIKALLSPRQLSLLYCAVTVVRDFLRSLSSCEDWPQEVWVNIAMEITRRDFIKQNGKWLRTDWVHIEKHVDRNSKSQEDLKDAIYDIYLVLVSVVTGIDVTLPTEDLPEDPNDFTEYRLHFEPGLEDSSF